MANDNTLNIEITANADKAKQGLTEAAKALKTFSGESERLTTELRNTSLESAKLVSQQSNLTAQFKNGSISADKYEAELADIARQETLLGNKSKKLSADLARVNRSTTALTGGAQKLGKGMVKGAVPAMTSFSQVVQDAPFGIRGVANNIQQLTMQMGHLSANAGGTKKALAAMVGTLTGPAGILLAVSLVTSLMVSYGDEIKEFIFGTDEAKLATQRLNDALRAQIGIRKQLKDQLSLATSIAVAEAKLAGKSAEEQFNVRQKFANAEILALEQLVKNAVKIRKEASVKAGKAANQDNEEIQNTAKKAYKDLLELEKNLNDAKAQLYLADLNEKIRVQEASKKVTKETAKDAFGFGALTTSGTIFSDVLNAASDFQVSFSDIMVKTTESTKEQLEGMALAFDGLVTKIKGVAESGLFNAVADIAFSIGDAIGSGVNVLKAAGNAMLDTLGSILVQFGELTLAYGIANLALFTAITSGPNPLSAGAAIAAGVALIAIGGAVKAFSKNALSGGDSSGGSDYSSGGSNSNFRGSSGFSGGGSSGGTYVFEIAGTKLVGVLKNTLDRNRALGGSLTIG